MPSLSVLLFGSTGNIGALVAQALAKRTAELGRVAFHARSSVSPEKEALYAAVEAQGLERVEKDIRDIATYRGTFLSSFHYVLWYSPPSGSVITDILFCYLTGFDIVICCVSHDAILDQILITDTAVAAGVRHIIPSEFGGDLSCPAFHAKKAMLWRYKLVVQAHLERVAREEPAFGYTLVYCGIFTELMFGGMMCNILGVDTKAFKGEVFGKPNNVICATSAKE
jgi:hypothetical protein